MAVLQHYYTSFVNRETGSAGFQVKAISEGISPEMQAIIPRLIAYRIPANMEERAIERHPVALRYYYHSPRECILLCSQSSGNDENGRPGNFFAHSVVMPPSELAYQPPILYWHSPFWRKQAMETQIKPLPEFDAEQSLDLIDEMWAFLEEDGRKEAFYRLMCAIIHSGRTRRRIIIVDTDKNVALWVAAVSCMLPPACRLLLSFSTYHHDPNQSLFLITGTVDDGTSRISPEESISHFVLDGKTNRTSDVEESTYAKLIKTYSFSSRYTAYMLQFFVWYERRFPIPTSIDEQLDLFATYVKLRWGKKPDTWTPPMVEAIKIVLSTFEQLASYNDEDRQELTELRDLLEDARQHHPNNKEIQGAYDRVALLYRKLDISTDGILRDDLIHYTKRLLDDPTPDEAIELLTGLHQKYSDDLFTQYANEAVYLSYLTDRIKHTSHTKLCLVWKYIGPYLRPASPAGAFFLRSVRILNSLHSQQATELAALIRTAIRGQELEWLRLLVGQKLSRSDNDLVTHFYWHLASSLDPEQREPYRAIVRDILPKIADLELSDDLSQGNLRAKVSMLNKWVDYARRTAIKSPSSVLNEGLDQLKASAKRGEWETLILDVLLDDDLRPLLENREALLVREIFSELSLQQFSRRHSKLYYRYKDYSPLSETSRIVLAGMVAMLEGHLDADVSMQLYRYVSRLGPEAYYGEVSSFIAEFLSTNITELDHSLMVTALFVGKYHDRFCLAYWSKVYAMLAQLLTSDLERAVRLFGYWFSRLPGWIPQADQKYALHIFFLTLRRNMTDGQHLPDFSKALNNLAGKAGPYPWYPLLQSVFVVNRKSFVDKSQDLMKFVQKRLPGQKVDEQAQEEERKFIAQVGALLTKGTVRDQHLQHISSLCREESREVFWSFYQDRLIQVLTSPDIEHILEVFTFWFDDGFQQLGAKPYLAQEFFIKLPQVFESARKERDSHFRKTAEQVIKHFDRLATERRYRSWYPLLYSFFVEGLPARRER